MHTLPSSFSELPLAWLSSLAVQYVGGGRVPVVRVVPDIVELVPTGLHVCQDCLTDEAALAANLPSSMCLEEFSSVASLPSIGRFMTEDTRLYSVFCTALAPV